MIERVLSEKEHLAQSQGLGQRFLTGFLRMNYNIARALGFRDVQVNESQTLLQQGHARELKIGEPQWTAQIDKLMRMGFHERLGLSEQDYYEGMPPLEVQPERFKGRFDIPILVDPRVGLVDQLKRHSVELTGSLTEAEIARTAMQEAAREDAPKAPYQMWIHTYNMRDPKDGQALWERKRFDWDERGLTAIEGLAVLREFPDIFDRVRWEEIELIDSVISSRSQTGRTSQIHFKLQRNGLMNQVELDRELSHPEYTHRALLMKGRVGLK